MSDDAIKARARELAVRCIDQARAIALKKIFTDCTDELEAFILDQIAGAARELAAAQALIRWCYHDTEAMPPEWRETIEAARRT